MVDCIDKPLYARIGDYVLVRVIGRATHYTLYQAANPRVGRMVLIKTLHVTADSKPGEATREPSHVLEARLQREADALALLAHPNILKIYETGEQNGYPYLVLEYLNGHPLRQHLDQRSLSLAEAIGILEQLADAIDTVHSHDILHRDIRPSNVIIQHDGRVKLVDFGLARQPDDITVTLMGALVGEPAYLSPEQLQNKPATPSSDLWALGVLMYEMLAGKPPFQASSFPLVAHQVLMGQPPPIAGVTSAVQAVVVRALEKDPELRYGQAREMIEALRKAGGSAAAPSLQFHSSRRRTFAMTGVGALLLAAGLTISLYLAHSAHQALPQVPTAAAATFTVPTASPSSVRISPR